MPVTKVIDSVGTIGVNCDYNTIDAWWAYVVTQSDPDQIGLLRGAHSGVAITLSAGSIGSADSQTVCPRLIAAIPTTSGSLQQGSQLPANCATITGMTIDGGAATGSNGIHYFLMRGVALQSLSITLGSSNSVTANIWIDRCSVSTSDSLVLTVNAGTASVSRMLFTNSFFMGDGGPFCGTFTAGHPVGATCSIAFVNCAMHKGFSVTNNTGSPMLFAVQNSVDKGEEADGFSTSGSGITTSYATNAQSQFYISLIGGIVYTYVVDGTDIISDEYNVADWHHTSGTAGLVGIGSAPSVSGWSFTGMTDIDGVARPVGGTWDIGPDEWSVAAAAPMLSTGIHGRYELGLEI